MSNAHGASLFISSTILDLVDVRDRLAEVVEAFGLRAVRSEAVGFGASRSVAPHVAALRQLERADGILAIIDERYGHRIDTEWPLDVIDGFGRSPAATEVLHALRKRKTALVYVRKKIWDDYHNVHLGHSEFPEDRKYQDFDGTMELLSRLIQGPFSGAGKPWIQPFTDVGDIEEDLRGYIGSEVGRCWAMANQAFDSRAVALALKAVQACDPAKLEERLSIVFGGDLGKEYCHTASALAALIQVADKKNALSREHTQARSETERRLNVRLRVLKQNILLQMVAPEYPLGRSDEGPFADALEQTWKVVVARSCGPDAVRFGARTGL